MSWQALRTGFRNFSQRWLMVFGSAFILLFFSEYFFVNEGPGQAIVDRLADNRLSILPHILEFGAYYALFAYVLHLTLAHYRVSSINGLFLAGVLFGWATEAVIVPIVYESIPVSFIFPSVGWHALVDVLLGWYIVRWVMRQNRWWASLLMFAALGAVWGAWATWVWVDPEITQILTPAEFRGFAFVTASVWLAGMLLLDAVGQTPFTPGRWEVRIVIGVILLLAAGMGFLYLPFSLLILLPLWLTLWALRRMSRRPQETDLLEPLMMTEPAWWNYPLVVLTPLVAAGIYPMFYASGTGIPTEDVTFLLFMVGTVWLLVAWVRPFLSRGRSSVIDT